LAAYAELDYFKVYLSDVGLLGAMANLPPKIVLQGNKIFEEFRGSLTENYGAQELARGNYELYYWSSENTAEIDFVIQNEDEIYPIEVKSGSSNKKKSLKVYIEKYEPKLAIRVSPMNLRKDGQFLNCPLYLLSELPSFI
jgi:uncharacterized protein